VRTGLLHRAAEIDLNNVGYLIVGLFVVTWLVALAA
jgi:high-affinity nickel permease